VYKEDGYDITREFTEDDLALSEICWNATNALLNDLDIDEMEIEPFVELVPGSQGGSIDLLGLSASRECLLILDYKFGSVRVSPVESPNLGLYGISARHDPKTADMFKKVKKVVFAIVQPRVKGVVTMWETDQKWLDDFLHKHQVAVKGTGINPGSHCKYCPAEPYCEERRRHVAAANLLGARDQDELKAAAEMVVEVEDWCKSIKAEMYIQMVRGVPVPGWKIVEKRASRKWVNEADVMLLMHKYKQRKPDYTSKPKLLTPAQLEKMLKKNKVVIKDLNEFIISVSPGTTIATEDDSREAVIVSDVQGKLKEMMK
jgi:hypothetical protein